MNAELTIFMLLGLQLRNLVISQCATDNVEDDLSCADMLVNVSVNNQYERESTLQKELTVGYQGG
jgi:hypothetical protein